MNERFMFRTSLPEQLDKLTDIGKKTLPPFCFVGVCFIQTIETLSISRTSFFSSPIPSRHIIKQYCF